MGWFLDDLPEHEGYVKALVFLEGTDPASRCYRELGYPLDKDRRDDIQAIQAGCDCGWRSARWRPRPWWNKDEKPGYTPYIAYVSPQDTDQARDLWTKHAADCIAAERPVTPARPSAGITARHA